MMRQGTLKPNNEQKKIQQKILQKRSVKKGD
jgi:hypothetical protein